MCDLRRVILKGLLKSWALRGRRSRLQANLRKRDRSRWDRPSIISQKRSMVGWDSE